MSIFEIIFDFLFGIVRVILRILGLGGGTVVLP